jgi:hypothetical protein
MDVLEACKILMEQDNILSSKEKEYMNDCINSDNPELFIQVSIDYKVPILISILEKIEKLNKEIHGEENE